MKVRTNLQNSAEPRGRSLHNARRAVPGAIRGGGGGGGGKRETLFSETSSHRRSRKGSASKAPRACRAAPRSGRAPTPTPGRERCRGLTRPSAGAPQPAPRPRPPNAPRGSAAYAAAFRPSETGRSRSRPPRTASSSSMPPSAGQPLRRSHHGNRAERPRCRPARKRQPWRLRSGPARRPRAASRGMRSPRPRQRCHRLGASSPGWDGDGRAGHRASSLSGHGGFIRSQNH